MIKGVLFDKDGTLIPFQEFWHSIYADFFHSLQYEWLIPDEVVSDLKTVSGFNETHFEKESLLQHASTRQLLRLWETRLALHCRPDGTRCSYEKLSDLLSYHSTWPHRPISPLPGVVSTLYALEKSGIRLGIATADTLSSTRFTLSQAGLLSSFHFIGADDTVSAGKPSPEIARAFFHQEGLHPREVVVVGDSLSDLAFAMQAGTQFIGLDTPYNDSDGFRKAGALTVKRFDDILPLIITWGMVS
ncbi:HAD family hydrolase [Anoxynatronum buryatiense]|uniref:Phosphoglycolate phosphatase n=1 Tax=Anoxynatronum buryatiense TaxID=489973 RepID=A0AA45WT18_9CLOT|nr:HAD family hydrolase [Anoxynatronum buryatiense]SMP40232.1 phosphoglycolate phosphatase [Anoxynatronum buryatiense]